MNTLLVSIRAKPTNNNPFKYCLNNTILFEWNLLGSRVNVNLTIALCRSERYILSVLRLLRFYLFGFVYFLSPANKSIWCNRVQVLLFSIISLMFHAVIDLSVHVETRRNSNGGRKEKLLNFIVKESMRSYLSIFRNFNKINVDQLKTFLSRYLAITIDHDSNPNFAFLCNQKF